MMDPSQLVGFGADHSEPCMPMFAFAASIHTINNVFRESLFGVLLKGG